MAKLDLNKMMETRSPLIAKEPATRETIESVDLYTSPQQKTKPKKLRTKADIRQAENMMEMLRRNEVIRQGDFIENYAIERTTEQTVLKYTTHLAPMLIKAIKRISLESDMKDYEVVQAAIIEYLDNREAL